ncbi:MAG: hypothetical protein C4332_03145 [Meiothermus sp.]
MLEVLDIVLILLAAGLLLAVLVRPKPAPGSERLETALAEVRRREGHFPSLRKTLRQVQVYGRDLTKLPLLIAETERFLAKPGLDGPTKTRLLARREELWRTFETGVAFLERLGAEMVLDDPHEPPSLVEFPTLRLELRDVLHRA